MGLTGSIFRVMLLNANRTEVHGLDQFLGLLDKRHDIKARERGLVTGKIPVQLVGVQEKYD